MNLKPEEISKVIRSQIKYYSNALEQSEIGTVLTVGDGIVRASGLSNCLHLKMVHMVWLRTLKKTVYLLCF